MNMRRHMVETVLDVLLLVIGVVVLWFFLSSAQTRHSIERQDENFEIKLGIARQRMTQNAEEALDNLASYDAFSQAKLDTVTGFLNEHPRYERIAEIAAQWGLSEFYVTDAQGNVVYPTVAAPDISGEPFATLISTSEPVVSGTQRYYIQKLEGGGYAIGAREYSDKLAELTELQSPENALKTITVGGGGFIFAVDPETQAFTYMPDQELIGQPASAIGLDAASLHDGRDDWLTLDGTKYYARTHKIGEQLFTAVVPESELTTANNRTVMLSLIVFAAAMVLLIAYVLILRNDEATNPLSAPEYIQLGNNLYYNRTMGAKIRNVAIICLVAIFGLSFYVQTLSALSRQSIISHNKLQSVADILNDNDARIQALTEEYAAEYTGRAQNVAWTLNEDPGLINDAALMEISKNAQVSDIFVFNGRGAVVATNTVYKDFVLSDEEEDQSYSFWSVVKGYKDVYVQDAQPDDTPEQNYKQFVGVKRIDDKGMVQLGVLPRRLKNRLKATESSYVLNSIAVENGGFLFAVNKDDGTFIAYPKAKYEGRLASEYGLTAAAMKDEFEGYQTIDGEKCFVTCLEHGDAYLYTAVPVSAIFSTRLTMALIVTAGSLVVILILCAFLLLSRKMYEPAPESEHEGKGPRPQPKRFFRVVTANGESRVVQSAASRWSAGFNWNEYSSEQKLLRVLYGILILAGLALAVWMMSGAAAAQKDSILAYILSANWEKAPSIFSLTYILLIGIEVLIVAGVVRKLILFGSRRFGARSETVGRLLDSFIKYASVIGVIFYGLNFIGIDSAALMTSAGILALVVGLGAQKLIADILAGISIVFEGEFRVGDIVTVGDWCGTVMEIGIRTTKIQSGGSDIKILCNSAISGVVNMTKQYSYASADIGIEYDESLEHVESILNKELPLMKDKVAGIVTGPFYKGVVELGDSAVIIRIVAQCQEKDRVQLGRDMNRELKLIFDRNDISIPFPRIVVCEPVVHADATRAEQREAAVFVEEQKELTKDIPVIKEGS